MMMSGLGARIGRWVERTLIRASAGTVQSSSSMPPGRALGYGSLYSAMCLAQTFIHGLFAATALLEARMESYPWFDDRCVRGDRVLDELEVKLKHGPAAMADADGLCQSAVK